MIAGSRHRTKQQNSTGRGPRAVEAQNLPPFCRTREGRDGDRILDVVVHLGNIMERVRAKGVSECVCFSRKLCVLLKKEI